MSLFGDAYREKHDRELEDEAEIGAGVGAGGATPADDAAIGNESEAKKQIARLEAESEDLRQTLVRRQADFDNFRKRVDRERREDRERAVALLAESILPVLDNFERALAAHQDPAYQEYRRGFEMIFRQMVDLLAQHGIERMASSVGQRFDPHSHHAIERIETSEYPEGTVVGELQAGYKFRERVLRPAQVRVAAVPGAQVGERPHKAH